MANGDLKGLTPRILAAPTLNNPEQRQSKQITHILKYQLRNDHLQTIEKKRNIREGFKNKKCRIWAFG